MKKFLVSFIVLALCLFAVACGKTTDSHKCDPTKECCDGEGVGCCDPEKEDCPCVGEDCPCDPTKECCDENSVICKIQTGLIAEGKEVTVNECVVTAVYYAQDESFNNTAIKGIYVSDIIPQAKPYTGIYVFIKATAPVDEYSVGDKLEVKGIYKEYYENSQIESTEIQKLGTADVPKPAEISDPASIATPFEVTGQDEKGYDVYSPTANHGEDAEKYEGVLVRVTDVEITNKYIGHGNFELDNSLVVTKTLHYYEGDRSEGVVFESAKGILVYEYDAFRLAPRAESDLVIGVHPPKDDDDVIDDSDNEDPDVDFEPATIKEIQSGTVAERTAVKIEKAIVISPVIEQTKGGNTMYSFYVSDGNKGDYSGLYIYNATAAAPVKGDELTIEGKALYYKNSQSELGQWEIGSKDDVSCKITEKTGTGKTVPAALQKASYTALSDKDRGSLIELTDELTVKSVEKPEGKDYTKITFEEKVGNKELIAENFGEVTFPAFQAGDKLHVKGIYDVIFGSNGFYILSADGLEKRIY